MFEKYFLWWKQSWCIAFLVASESVGFEMLFAKQMNYYKDISGNM